MRGKRLLHLMCHIGLDTLSWARRGAVVTGLDFSRPALDTAASLAGRAGMAPRGSSPPRSATRTGRWPPRPSTSSTPGRASPSGSRTSAPGPARSPPWSRRAASSTSPTTTRSPTASTSSTARSAACATGTSTTGPGSSGAVLPPSLALTRAPLALECDNSKKRHPNAAALKLWPPLAGRTFSVIGSSSRWVPMRSMAAPPAESARPAAPTAQSSSA